MELAAALYLVSQMQAQYIWNVKVKGSKWGRDRLAAQTAALLIGVGQLQQDPLKQIYEFKAKLGSLII